MSQCSIFLFIGKIPSWMEGVLIRNGPGMHTIGETKYNHWFDGMALLHSFTIKNGRFVISAGGVVMLVYQAAKQNRNPENQKGSRRALLPRNWDW